MLRIGHGYDAHRFQDGGRLVLGGVAIDHDRSLAAHSDGDVALHALCDALLGAAGLGDIGRHFPDTDPRLKGIDSRVLLRRVHAELARLGYRVGNVDLTIVAQRPRLAPYIEQMRAAIAADLGLEPGAVNIKATTTEGMGFEGRGEGISAYAVALLYQR
ncbi:2-C-methyl-D-erythritol 2,4-cyclodiphosphate synthase [Candidatus Methylocalor cossyra]|uniref:2-C-methyl-D-erythritol 2,4-cyclodiphosphate synthase n=1 Tax=Candidatus Methylocalor cossyra TaxID=3108543 RepID=A0ABP1C7M0_9GAMM